MKQSHFSIKLLNKLFQNAHCFNKITLLAKYKMEEHFEKINQLRSTIVKCVKEAEARLERMETEFEAEKANMKHQFADVKKRMKAELDQKIEEFGNYEKRMRAELDHKTQQLVDEKRMKAELDHKIQQLVDEKKETEKMMQEELSNKRQKQEEVAALKQKIKQQEQKFESYKMNTVNNVEKIKKKFEDKYHSFAQRMENHSELAIIEYSKKVRDEALQEILVTRKRNVELNDKVKEMTLSQLRIAQTMKDCSDKILFLEKNLIAANNQNKSAWNVMEKVLSKIQYDPDKMVQYINTTNSCNVNAVCLLNSMAKGCISGDMVYEMDSVQNYNRSFKSNGLKQQIPNSHLKYGIVNQKTNNGVRINRKRKGEFSEVTNEPNKKRGRKN